MPYQQVIFNFVEKKKPCSVCKENFQKKGKISVCSTECYMIRKKLYQRTYRNLNKPISSLPESIKNCKMCNKEISGHRKKYCSDLCARNSNDSYQKCYNRRLRAKRKADRDKCKEQSTTPAYLSKPSQKQTTLSTGQKSTNDTSLRKGTFGPL